MCGDLTTFSYFLIILTRSAVINVRKTKKARNAPSKIFIVVPNKNGPIAEYLCWSIIAKPTGNQSHTSVKNPKAWLASALQIRASAQAIPAVYVGAKVSLVVAITADLTRQPMLILRCELENVIERAVILSPGHQSKHKSKQIWGGFD